MINDDDLTSAFERVLKRNTSNNLYIISYNANTITG